MNQERYRRGDLIRFEDPKTPYDWQHGVAIKTRKDQVGCIIEEAFSNNGPRVHGSTIKTFKADDIRLRRLPSPSLLGE